MSDTDPLPSVTPYLVVRHAAEAIAFYKQAFDAKELFVMTLPGTEAILHAQLAIGNSQIMLAEEMPDMNPMSRSPKSLGGSPVTIHLYCDNVDKTFEQAVAAGATVTMELMDAFWGDRYGRLEDPFGHHWSLAQPIEDVAHEEMAKRALELFGGEGS
ncbi:hypothetical protein Pla110_06160 [Polystyrenella longa]|uniref:VOC domain-containing protein n=1 Tax=Polystyrenella longa TaxID=2528007 RepID=A0A518CI60_9PLAN|nr:VOC family protein [Polystyrenella longa]QDU78912.1 hypothetical protein Pla110_06160 [Polystyrenella longa]